MQRSLWQAIGYTLYVIAVLDFALSWVGYDLTGFYYGPLVLGCLGWCCFNYTKEPTLAEGEELLVLENGKQANATVSIQKDFEGNKIKNTEVDHKLFLTNQTLQIDGEKVNEVIPYSSIQSVTKDTHSKMDMALTLLKTDNQSLKLLFGMGRSKKRDLFIAAIQTKSHEFSQNTSPPND